VAELAAAVFPPRASPSGVYSDVPGAGLTLSGGRGESSRRGVPRVPQSPPPRGQAVSGARSDAATVAKSKALTQALLAPTPNTPPLAPALLLLLPLPLLSLSAPLLPTPPLCSLCASASLCSVWFGPIVPCLLPLWGSSPRVSLVLRSVCLSTVSGLASRRGSEEERGGREWEWGFLSPLVTFRYSQGPIF